MAETSQSHASSFPALNFSCEQELIFVVLNGAVVLLRGVVGVSQVTHHSTFAVLVT